MNSRLEVARALLLRADGDRYAVESFAADANAPVWILGFHAQQAVEKSLKAALSLNGIEYPRTHNLSMLLELLRRHGLMLPPAGDDVSLLIPFGVALRYDDLPDDEPPALDRAWVTRIVAGTLLWAKAQIAAAGQEPLK